MDTFQIRGIFKNNICRAREIDDDEYAITMDTQEIGVIAKEKGGWYIKETKNEALSAENAQLIGQFIDRRSLADLHPSIGD